MATTQILSLPATVAGATPASSGTAWAFGSDVTLSASLSTTINVIGIQFQNTDIPAIDVNQHILFEITVGGVTKLQIPFNMKADSLVGYNYTSGSSIQAFYLPEPYVIVAGSAVVVKVTDSISSALTYSGFKLLYQENLAPTVILNSPADTSTDDDSTPILDFTGTDTDNESITYHLQLDQESDFGTNRCTGGAVTKEDEYASTPATNAFDGSNDTKWFSFRSTGWLGYQFPSSKKYIVRTYSITSGDDEPTRDPKDWCLLGSNDGTNWDLLDTVTGASWSGRKVTNTYTVDTPGNYEYYKVDISLNNGASGAIQLSEIRMYSLYEKYSATDSGFANPDTGGDTDPFNSVENIQFTVPSADQLSNDTYYWKVQGKDPAGTNVYGVYSSTRSFTVNNTSPTVALDTADELETDDTTPTLLFTGTDTDSDRITYQIQIDVDSDFDSKTTGGTASESGYDFGLPGSNVFDGNVATKWYVASTTPWVQYRFGSSAQHVIRRYIVTPSEDEPTRDPKSWVLQGSNNGSSWDDLDTRTNQYFYGRNISREFTVTTHGLYEYYRFNITANNGGSATQMSELQLFSSLNKISDTDTGFVDVDNGGESDPFPSADQISYTVQGGEALLEGMTYYWRVRAVDPSGSLVYGAWATTQSFSIITVTTYPVTVSSKVRIKSTGTTKTVGAKLRIKKLAVEKTVQAKTRVKKAGNDKTISVKGRIKSTGVIKTVSAKVRVFKSGDTKTVQAKTRIKVVDNNKTVSSKVRIKKLFEKTASSKIRIKSTGITKTVGSKVRIKKLENTQTASAKARIKVSNITKTVTAKSRIKTIDIEKTVSAKTRIKSTSTTQTISALVAIQSATQTVTKTVSAKVRIKKIGIEKTVNAKTRIKIVDNTKTVSAKTRIKLLNEKTVSAKARVKNTSTQTVSSKVRIRSTGETKTVSSKTRIKIIDNTQTVSAKVRIKQASITKTVSSKTRIKKLEEKTVIALVRVKKLSNEQTVSAKTRIKSTGELKTISAKTRVKKSEEKTVSAKVRIKTLNETSVQVRARIKTINTTTTSAKSRIKRLGESQTISTKTRIKSTGNIQTLSVKVRVVNLFEKNVSAKVRIKYVSITKTISAKVRVKKLNTKNITSKTRIKTSGIVQTVGAKVNIVGLNTKIITARVRIKRLNVTKSVSSRVTIVYRRKWYLKREINYQSKDQQNWQTKDTKTFHSNDPKNWYVRAPIDTFEATE